MENSAVYHLGNRKIPYLDSRSNPVITGLLVFLFFYQNAFAQIFGIQYREQFRYTSVLSYPQDSFYRVVGTGAKIGYYPIARIFTYDQSFNLSDSTLILNGVILDKNEPIRVNDRLYWAVTYYDTINTGQGYMAVLELDTLYKHKALHKISNGTGYLNSVNIIHLNNLYFAAFVQNFSLTTVYKLNEQFNKIDSVNYTVPITDLNTIRNEILLSCSGTTSYPCKGKYFDRVKLLYLDTNLQQTNCLSFDSIGKYTTPGYPNPQRLSILGSFSSKILSISDQRYFILGSTGLNYSLGGGRLAIVNSILDVNNNILKTIVIGDSTANYNYFENSNFVSIKNSSIVSVGCIGNDFQFPGIAQPQSTKIIVTKLDTNGIVTWTREYGGDMFYRPGSVVFNKDGGCTIGGWRYDSTKMKTPYLWESFLLRLDESGYYNSVGITKYDTNKEIQVKCYPNPTDNNYVSLSVLLNEKFKISLFDSYGRLLRSYPNYTSTENIDVSPFPPGLYYFKLAANNQLYYCSFVKSNF